MFSKLKKLIGVVAMPALLLVGSLAIAGQGSVVDVSANETATFNKPVSAIGSQSGLSANDVSNVIKNIANIMAFIVIALSVIFIIIGAFQWMSGNEKDGKEKVKNAVIGLIIAIVAYLIVQLVARATVGLVSNGGANIGESANSTGGLFDSVKN